MQEVKEDVQSRMKEIDVYCDFLKLVDEPTAQISYKNELTQQENIAIVSVELKKILIANTFLLMYNLLESCVSRTIAELYLHFNGKNQFYSALSALYKSLYLRENLASLKDRSYSEDTLQSTVDQLILNAIQDVPIKLSKKYKFSGNVDASEIRATAKLFNIRLSKSNGDKLEDIKNYRNKLAHGELTFSFVGSEKSVKDILDYKNQLFPYLAKFISDVEKHINDN